MINKDVFIYKCAEKGITKKAAEKLYKKTAESPENLEKKAALKKMRKMAFDLGFNDSLRIFKMLSEKDRSQ